MLRILQFLLFFTLSNAKTYLRASSQRSLENTDIVLDPSLTDTIFDPSMSKIVGGSPVGQATDYPFFADWHKGCGGSLVAPDIVLTAAHCEMNPIVEPFSFGSLTRHDWYAPDVAFGHDYIVHPEYDHENGNMNDFMVVKLEEPVDYQYIHLNSESSVPINQQELTVIGFGSTSETGGYPTDLGEVMVNYIEDCKSDEYEYSLYSYLHSEQDEPMMCAGSNGGGRDSCKGDSGGPLFFQNGDGTFVQVGVVSWGDGCGRADSPGVYSRISSGYSWIVEQVCAMSEYPPDYCSGRTGKITAAPTTQQPTTSYSRSEAPTEEPVTSSVGFLSIKISSAPVTGNATSAPTVKSTISPTSVPTATPTNTTTVPTSAPTTLAPTSAPTPATTTGAPTSQPTVTRAPTIAPTTAIPTSQPTATPSTVAPTNVPTTTTPTEVPTSQSTPPATTVAPTTSAPTTATPTDTPSPTNHATETSAPTAVSTTQAPATSEPTTAEPTPEPTAAPTTKVPTSPPTPEPTTEAHTTEAPTIPPTPEPTEEPTTEAPTTPPTPEPTEEPTTEAPTSPPTPEPTEEPTTEAPTSPPTTPTPTTDPPTPQATTNAPTDSP